MKEARVLLWDPTEACDGRIYQQSDIKPRSAVDKLSIRSLANGTSWKSNLNTLLGRLSAVQVVSSMAVWSRLLLESEAAKQFFVIFISFNKDTSKSPSAVEILQFTASQLMHISHYVVVLSDDRDRWTDLIRMGAHDVGNSVIGKHEMDNYQQRINHLTKELTSRAKELKLLLGLNEDFNPFNPMKSLCSYSLKIAPDLSLSFTEEQISKVRKILCRWDFYAHDLDYDELLLTAFIVFKHAFTMEGLEKQHVLSDPRLFSFLSVVRNCYHPSNPYHNYRHAIDVLQATFYILVSISALPGFDTIATGTSQNTESSVLSPVDSISLLIAALGHDAGHPGVPNNVLVSCNAPLAKIYNDKSVLESYHSAMLCQIAGHYWPGLFQDSVKKSIIVESILATDMARHFDYMERFEDPDHWSRECESGSIGCMIIKCADISNVTRKLDISARWGKALGEEYLDIVELESLLGIAKPTTSVLTPTNDDTALAKGQIFFVNTYCLPLFELLVKHFPALQFMLENMKNNLAYWEEKLQKATGR